MSGLLKRVITKIRRLTAHEGSTPPPAFDYKIEGLDKKDSIIIDEVYWDRVMGTPLALANLIEAVRYIEDRKIQGSIVEAGVWRGGSVIAAIKVLQNQNSFNRDVYLYDTFEGMTKPSKYDRRANDSESALKLKWKASSEILQQKGYEGGVAAAATIEDVQNGINLLKYPSNKIHFIKGKVESTLYDIRNLPSKIALLRLDTDWYESTKVELEVLWPLLSSNGVLILDDYDYWDGCKKAVDEYFFSINENPFKIRMDHGRIIIKE